MSAVKEIGKRRRYLLLPVLVLILALVVMAKAPMSGSSSTVTAGADPGKASGPQAAMPSGGAGSGGATANPSGETTLPGSIVVGHSVKNDVSPPLRDIPPAPYQASQEAPENRQLPIVHKTERVKDPVVQNWFGALAMPTPIVNVDGINSTTSGCGCYPPDTQGDVGPNHYIQWVNSSFQIFDKTGATLQAARPGNTLWAGFGGTCQTSNSGDPITLYDPLADRWMMSQFTTSAPFYQCIAVSSSPDPLGTWNRYAFLVSSTLLNDYPHFGVWPDGYYMTSNRFLGTSYDSPAILAFDRVKMIAGDPATFVLFNPGNYFYALLPADQDGPTPPPAGAPNYVATTSGTSNTMRLWKFHVDYTTPLSSTLTGPVNVITAPFDPDIPCTGSQGRSCIPQPGTTVGLDALGGRPMYRLAYRNFGDHESLITNQTVVANGVTGLRWYEVRDPGGRPYIYQQGTYAPDSNYRWMGSIAMDKDGNIGLGYSVSSSTVFPSVRYTGRLSTDPLGTMPQGEAEMVAGTGSQTGSGNRWGDYSMMTVDPSDDCTFWFTEEYQQITTSVNWRTRIGSFKFPSCGAATPTGTPPTATHTPTAAPTSTPTATACANYTSATATATIEPGTTDIGNHCDDCTTYITLPFPVKMYDRTFSNAYVSSNGIVQFNSSDNAFGNACLPVPVFEYSAVAFWDDLTDNATGDGVFTSVTGSAPNRVFNVEWRSHILSNNSVANFEIRMFEGQRTLEMIYGTLGQPGTGQTVGVIRDMSIFSQYLCNTSGLAAGTKITWTAPACFNVTDTPTPLPTHTPTNTPAVTNTPCVITFTDVHSTDYFYDPVTYLYCHGAISGYADNTFRPGNLTTRGQLSKIVVLAEGWPTYTPPNPTFTDVPESNAFYSYIETAYHHDIISGYTCGTNCLEFRPGNNVTRAQLTKIVVLAENWEITPPSVATFRDVP
ncbi:MAG: S-layer homology domain-containing protein, partial [Chloroflexia bacterium]